MPYSGEASFSPNPLADVQHFVVMTPKSMTFTREGSAAVSVDARRVGLAIMVVTNVKPGEDLSFRIAGTEIFPAEGQQGAQGGGDEAGGGARAESTSGRQGQPPRRRTWAPPSMRPTRCSEYRA